MEEWPEIDFIEDRDGCLFTVKVHRKSVENLKKKNLYPEKQEDEGLKVQSLSENAPINAPLSDLQVRILDMVRANPEETYDDMQEKLGKNRTTIMRNIQQLKEIGILKRIGSKKTGAWEITE